MVITIILFIFIDECADQRRDGLKILITIFVPAATAPAFPHFDTVILLCTRDGLRNCYYVTDAETQSACTFHDILYIIASYSSVAVTLM